MPSSVFTACIRHCPSLPAMLAFAVSLSCLSGFSGGLLLLATGCHADLDGGVGESKGENSALDDTEVADSEAEDSTLGDTAVADSKGEEGADRAFDARAFADTTEGEESIFAPDNVLEVRVSVDEGKWDQLRFERQSIVQVFGPGCYEPLPDVFNYYPAEVQIEKETLGTVGVRAKGLLGSINPARPSLKVKLHEYDSSLRYLGHKRFTFNNQNQDVSRLTACLSYHVFRTMGVPASRCNFAHVFVNDKDLGIYANVEPIKKPMLARLFGDDSGNLYEGNATDLRSGFRARLEKKTNETTNDWTDIDALIEAIEAPDDVFLEELGKVVDIGAFIRFSVAEALIGHWDGFGGNTNNYYFYRDPVAGLFYFIPWGADATFSDEQGAFTRRDPDATQVVYGKALLARRLYEHPDMQGHYRDAMEQLLVERWDTEALLNEFDRMQRLTSPLVMDPKAEEYLGVVASVRSFIETRKSRLLEELEGDVIPFQNELADAYTCMEKTGDISLSMSTTWGTIGTSNPFGTGRGSIEGDYLQNPMDLQLVGGSAGIDEDTPQGEGMASLVTLGMLTATRFLVVYLSLPIEDIRPNAIYETTSARVRAYFLVVTTGKPITFLGMVGPGSLRFGARASTEDGDAIDLEIDFEVWGEGLPSGAE